MLFQYMAPWLLLCAGMLLALRALPLVIAMRRHGWRIALLEDEETRWQRRSRERGLWRVHGHRRRYDERYTLAHRWRSTRIPDEEACERKESAAPQVPDITDPAMTMADWVEYLTTD